MDDAVYLVVVADDRFVAPLGITLTSIFQRTSGPIDVSVVLENASPEDRQKLSRLAEEYGHQLRLIEPEFSDRYRNAKSNQWVTKAAYYRLHLGDFLPPEAKRAIYVDSDILCLSDLRRLWNEPLDGKPLAAVQDPTVTEETDLGLEYELIGIGRHDGYFNSGVMVADVEQWRRERVPERILEHIEAVPKFGRFHDQSRLNAYFARRWKPLPLRYNLQARMMGIQLPGLEPTDPRTLSSSLADPVLVHFNGPCKPWQARLLNPFKKDYLQTWKESPWSDWRARRERPLVGEWRWFFGDLRRHWRQYHWCQKMRTASPLLSYAVVENREPRPVSRA